MVLAKQTAGRRLVVFGLFTGVAVILLAWTLQASSQDPIPEDLRQQVTFPLYYPERLPEGYSLVKGSARGKSDVVAYQFERPGSPNVTVTQQTKPAGFSFDDFHRRNLQRGRTVPTSLGDATVGTLGARTVLSLPTGELWILINSEPATPERVLEDLAKELRPVEG